jgi:hypothetical protein
LFTLIDTILAYNPDSKALWSPTEVVTFPPINKLMPVPTRVLVSTPAGFFINFTKKDSLTSSVYSKYQSPLLESSRETLFKDNGVKYINLNTKEKEIMISLSNYSILKSPSLNPPSTEWVYINLTVKDLEVITYF